MAEIKPDEETALMYRFICASDDEFEDGGDKCGTNSRLCQTLSELLGCLTCKLTSFLRFHADSFRS